MLTMQVIGNLGKDPEFKTTASGVNLAKFSLASNKKVKGDKVTTWVNVTVFDENKIKFLKEYVRKGTKLFIEGEPAARAWDKDGEAQASLDCTLGFGSKIEILSSERAENGGSSGGASTSTNQSSHVEDDLPDWD